MKLSLKFSRKQRYIIYSAFSAVFLGSVWSYSGDSQKIAAVIAFLVVFIGSLWVQRENLNKDNFLYVLILPVHLSVGVILSVLYFPNLGLLVKFVSLFFIGLILYAICLVNNIFMVVIEKQGIIPLYRAAVTWLLILLVVSAIPFFTGIFKLPIFPIYQMGIIGISTYFFAYYTIWVTSLDVESNKPNSAEVIFLGLLSSFLVVISGLSVSFMPTEPFLAALYVSTFLMFVLGYIQAHLKNNVTKRLIFDYVLIIAVFFVILLLFQP